ncbi:MAG: fibronectin type III domain-containing protein, partial [Oscillospiraceae bacterium]|nr:fibronectin type III domain-containing protein [Oscillospiraceae bacterium]
EVIINPELEIDGGQRPGRPPIDGIFPPYPPDDGVVVDVENGTITLPPADGIIIGEPGDSFPPFVNEEFSEPTDQGLGENAVQSSGHRPGNITWINSTFVNSTTLRFSWNVPSGSPSSYHFELWCGTAGRVVLAQDWHTNTLEIINLVSGGRYWIRVFARNNFGISDLWTWNEFAMASSLPRPAAPRNLDTNSLGITSASFAWTPSNNATGYQIELMNEWFETRYLRTVNISYTAQNMRPNIRYFIRIRARNGANQWGAWSCWYQFRTHAVSLSVTPANQTVARGNSVTFTANTGGAAVPVTWQLQGAPTGVTMSGTGNTRTIHVAASATAGTATVRVTAGGSVVNRTVTVGAPVQRTITWNSNGGNNVTPRTRNVFAGSQIGDLPIPTHSRGYTFAGWFTSQVGGTRITRTTIMQDHNVTYWAQWATPQPIQRPTPTGRNANASFFISSTVSSSNVWDTDGTQIRRRGHSNNSLWQFVHVTGDYFGIRCEASYRTHGPIRIVTQSGTNVQLVDQVSNVFPTNARWRLHRQANGTYRIESVGRPGYFLAESNPLIGTPIIRLDASTTSGNAATRQRWIIHPLIMIVDVLHDQAFEDMHGGANQAREFLIATLLGQTYDGLSIQSVMLEHFCQRKAVATRHE